VEGIQQDFPLASQVPSVFTMFSVRDVISMVSVTHVGHIIHSKLNMLSKHLYGIKLMGKTEGEAGRYYTQSWKAALSFQRDPDHVFLKFRQQACSLEPLRLQMLVLNFSIWRTTQKSLQI